MNNQQEEIELVRDVNATLIPHGEEFLLSKGEKITVTHKLGGNFTVMTLNGMYRIAAKDADAWIIRSGTAISANAIASAKNLRVIGRAGVGIDNINVTEATRRGVVVLNTHDVNTISAAEHTLGLMLSISRNIHLGHLSLLNGNWNRHELVVFI